MTSGWLAAIACAMCCSITVLPDFGDDTSRPRWPLPIGAMMSMIAAGDVLLGLDVALEHHRLVGEQRRQVLEQDLVLRVLRRLAVDLVDLDQREVALAVLRRADLAFDRVAGVQVEAADLRRRDVDVVGAGEVAGVGRAQEAEAVGQHFEHAVAEDRSRPSSPGVFSIAKIRSCLRIRLAPSISIALAMSSSSDTCLDLSSERCMGGGVRAEYGGGAALQRRRGSSIDGRRADVAEAWRRWESSGAGGLRTAAALVGGVRAA